MVDLDLVADLTTAVSDSSLTLVYLPEVDLASGEVVAMEALLRWHHPARGLLRTNDFMPAAEISGLAPAVGLRAFDVALADALTWAQTPGPWRLWLDVGIAELASGEYVRSALARISAAALPAGHLGLSATAETVVQLGGSAAVLAERFVGAGLSLAVIDTSLSLSMPEPGLPLSAIRLSPDVTRRLTDPQMAAYIGRLVGQAQDAGRSVCATGVQSWAEAARLCELGVDTATGYLFSGPQVAERAQWMLVNGLGWVAPVSVPGPRGQLTQV